MNRRAKVPAFITFNEEAMPGVHIVWLEAPDVASTAHPGQFITVNCEGLTLRRPFSVHQATQSQIAVLFKVVGKGTFWLSQRQQGDKIDILGPLGKGFTISPSVKNLLLVAGGIGIAPLLFLAQCASSHHQISLIHGVSTARELYSLTKVNVIASESKQSQNVIKFIPITEDGSTGEKGIITDILPRFLDWSDQVFACGPVDMYKAMANMSSPAKAPSGAKGQRNNLKLRKCQVSLEMRIGCGIGACYGCTINTQKGSKQVCLDGPVFELDDVLWQEVRM